MLAYVFWHAARDGVDPAGYAQRTGRFQSELKGQRLPGFLRSEVFVFSALPWLPKSTVYEEWYLLEGSAAMDILNDAAVGPALRQAHDDVARDAGAGTAGLYRLRAGTNAPSEGIWSYWFAKPAGMSYARLYEQLEPFTRSAALWGRQMVLGPTPEFCLVADKPLQLPATLAPQVFTGKRLPTTHSEEPTQ